MCSYKKQHLLVTSYPVVGLMVDVDDKLLGALLQVLSDADQVLDRDGPSDFCTRGKYKV